MPSTPNPAPTTLVWDLFIRLFHWSLVLAASIAGLTGFLLGKRWINTHALAGAAVGGLDKANREQIEDYLIAGAADRYGRKPRWMRSLPDDAVPIRNRPRVGPSPAFARRLTVRRPLRPVAHSAAPRAALCFL